MPYFLPLIPQILGNELSINKNNNAVQTAIIDYLKYHAQSFPQFANLTPEQLLERLGEILLFLGRRTFGFDLWKTTDGVNWVPVTLNGLGNPHNYGARMLFLSNNNDLYLGTANPFDGLEVWVKPNQLPRRRNI